jgi:tetratricopeptide (TPR) repeat protein
MLDKINQMMTRALQCFQSGNYDEAELILIKVLGTQPKNFDALHILGVLKGIKNQHQEALEFFRKALRVNSNDSFLNFNIAKAFSEIGDDEKALKFHSSATRLNPNHPEGWLGYGKSLSNLKKFDESLNLFNKAVTLNPEYAEAWTNRGCALKELGHFQQALDSFDKSLKINPYFAETWSNRGIALLELKRVEDALISYDRAIEIKPDYAEAWNNRGNALTELKREEEAVANYKRAIEIMPDFAEAYYNRGNALKELMRMEDALACFDNSIEVKPDYAEAYWNKSLSLLLSGDFVRGWNLYEWRWKIPGLMRNLADFPQPLWLGQTEFGGLEGLAGKTILVHSEQGLGDTLQFARYLPLLADCGARVIFELPAVLLGLLRGLNGVSEFVVKGQVSPPADFHCPLLSLPLAFKTTLESIPSPGPYLKADALKVKQWSERLGLKSRPRIGLVWSGNAQHKNDHNRSISLELLLSQLPDRFDWVSLQREVRDADRQALELHPSIRHFGTELADFTDTAALCELMDLVISVDTSVAHLSGALGRPTWVLLPNVPDWRWLLDRDDSPWYACIKLYRQREPSEWSPILQELSDDLLKFDQ